MLRASVCQCFGYR